MFLSIYIYIYMLYIYQVCASNIHDEFLFDKRLKNVYLHDNLTSIINVTLSDFSSVSDFWVSGQ